MFVDCNELLYSFYIGSLIVLSGPQGVAYVELPSNLPSLEAKQQGPSVKSARYVVFFNNCKLISKSSLKILDLLM